MIYTVMNGNRQVKFVSAETWDGERSCKQHGFYASERMDCVNNKYDGNRPLCNRKSGLMNEDELFIDWEKIEGETLNTKNICKKCMAYLPEAQLTTTS